MVKYNEVKETFEERGCKLLMTEEEFNLKPRKVMENYPYIASCGDPHEVCFNNFKNSLSGLKCPKCVLLKQSIDKKLNPLSNQELEFDSIEYLKTIIEDTFDVKFNGEGCLADCCIKPKHITEDSWLMVQIKSTAKPSSLRYKFDCHSKYINCIIMCFTLEKHNGRKKRISYQQGDNDFYWLNVNNKQHFYVIPEHELISRNYINIDKRSSISLNPNSKKGNNIWANEYLFDYTNITKMDEEKLKKMFHINIFV